MALVYYLVNRGHSVEYALNLSDYEKMIIWGVIEAYNEISEGGG